VKKAEIRMMNSEGTTKLEMFFRNRQWFMHRCRAHWSWWLASSVIAFGLLCCASTHANVYATRLLLNGGTNNIVAGQGPTVNISYLLNEPATLGVTVDIKSGATTVRSLVLTNGGAGAAQGTNLVIWDGRDSLGHIVSGGTYTVSVTATASGYSAWTQINSDTNSIWAPQGISVNRNMSSAYYGRVYVANADFGPNPGFNNGDILGIQKFNADGTYTDDGAVSDGGWPWPQDGISPLKLEVAGDDRVYVSDRTGTGFVLSFDPAVSSGSLRQVFRSDNAPDAPANFGGPVVSGAATNALFWMADSNSVGVGVRRWALGSGGILASNDTGITAVQTGGGSDLNAHPDDLAVDKSNRIYVVQDIQQSGDASPRVLRFPAYGGAPLTVADWKIGSGDDGMAGASGIAVNSASSLVAVAFQGLFDGFSFSGGSTRVFGAASGTNIATLQPSDHEIRDVAWDNAGNVYATDGLDHLWRAYSPPGTNQSTTVAIAQIQLTNQPAPPILSQPVYDGQLVRFTLYGEANVTYVILASTNLVNWFPVATNSSVFAVRQLAVPAVPGGAYYRAVVGQYQPARPFLTAQAMNAGQFQLMLTGEAGLTYIIQGSSDMKNWSPVATNNATTTIRQISVNSIGSPKFFRARVGP
jgi:hypothetical protein